MTDSGNDKWKKESNEYYSSIRVLATAQPYFMYTQTIDCTATGGETVVMDILTDV